jgi:hypothetical protein
MPRPKVGRPLPRAADAYTDRRKWDLWILSDDHHGPDWQALFGDVEFEQAWPALRQAVRTAVVVDVRDLGELGVSCAAVVEMTLNGRSRHVRAVWHYESLAAAPRLVTAYPTP